MKMGAGNSNRNDSQKNSSPDYPEINPGNKRYYSFTNRYDGFTSNDDGMITTCNYDEKGRLEFQGLGGFDQEYLDKKYKR